MERNRCGFAAGGADGDKQRYEAQRGRDMKKPAGKVVKLSKSSC